MRRLFCNQRRCGVDRDRVQFACGGAVVEPTDRLTRDPDRVHMGESRATALDSANNLVYIDALKRTIALADVHDGRFFVDRKTWKYTAGLDRCHGSSPS